ncbi:MAG TPA: endonuclease NucS [Candidatus Ozemobacteraceae bacterium]|nr:endonuclease NucS [Candidatus Ozemobacteraceae bacterium]
MSEYRKILSEQEVKNGQVCWDEKQDAEFRRVIPETLVFDMTLNGVHLEHLTIDWERRVLTIGDQLKQAVPGSEIVLAAPAERGGVTVQGRLYQPGERVMVRKRLSASECKQRAIKWYAREDDLYRRLFPAEKHFAVEIHGKLITNRAPDFERRILVIGDALRVFAPGDSLLLHKASAAPLPTLVIEKEVPRTDPSDDSKTIRAMVTRLISRPLQEFNEGEVKGLIALLDENKKLWERLHQLREENEKLKEQVSTLENVFDHLTRNSFFHSKGEFEDWVATHIGAIEKGVRPLHRDYQVTLDGGKPRRIDLLCQDRKGVLIAVELMYNPRQEDIKGTVALLAWLQGNISRLGRELTGGQLQAASIRGMVVTNRERPDLVEMCLQNGIKLCVINSGFVVDVLE